MNYLIAFIAVGLISGGAYGGYIEGNKLGLDDGYKQAQHDAIEHNVAEYNAKTGIIEWTSAPSGIVLASSTVNPTMDDLAAMVDSSAHPKPTRKPKK